MGVSQISHLHDGDILLLLLPESFRVLFSCAKCGSCYSNLTGITKVKYERINEMDSGHSNKMSSSFKYQMQS